jgi:glutaconate CoA-transferase subunit B
MGFVVDTSRAEAVPPPSTEEVEILREKCDPQLLILD